MLTLVVLCPLPSNDRRMYLPLVLSRNARRAIFPTTFGYNCITRAIPRVQPTFRFYDWHAGARATITAQAYFHPQLVLWVCFCAGSLQCGGYFLASGLFHGSCPLGPSELHSAHAARHLAWEEFENVIAEAARLWLRLAAMGQNYGTVSAGLFADYFWATFVLLVLFHGAQPTFRYYGWHSRTEAFVTLARRVSIHTLCGWVISAQLLFIGGLFK